MKTLVLGLGNPVLTDDGVGFAVVEEVRKTLDTGDVTVCEASVGGLSLLHLVEGYDRVIIIDAAVTNGAQPGEIRCPSPDEVQWSPWPAWTHGVPFATALELGRRLGMYIPKKIVVFVIEAADVETFGEELTPSVAAAVPKVVDLVLLELEGQGHDASASRKQ